MHESGHRHAPRRQGIGARVRPHTPPAQSEWAALFAAVAAVAAVAAGAAAVRACPPAPTHTHTHTHTRTHTHTYTHTQHASSLGRAEARRRRRRSRGVALTVLPAMLSSKFDMDSSTEARWIALVPAAMATSAKTTARFMLAPGIVWAARAPGNTNPRRTAQPATEPAHHKTRAESNRSASFFYSLWASTHVHGADSSARVPRAIGQYNGGGRAPPAPLRCRVQCWRRPPSPLLLNPEV